MASEESHGEFLSKFLDLLSNRSEILRRLWKQFVKERPAYFYGSECQMRHLAYIYACRGDEEARIALRQRVLRNLEIGEVFGIEELLRLEGDQGLARCVQIVDAPDSRVSDGEIGAIDYAIEEVFGKEWRDSWLKSNADSRLARIASVENKPEPYKKLDPPIIIYEELMSHVEEFDFPRNALNSFVKNASDEQFVLAAQNLPKDRRFLPRYLRLFRERIWPIEPEPLFEVALTKGRGTWKAVRAAFRALEGIESPKVRKFGLKHLQDRYRGQLAADLFKNNYQPGDESVLRKRADRSIWPEEMHSILMSLRDIVEERPEIDSQYVFYLYDTIPCGFCRSLVVKELIKRNLVTDEIRQECMHDSEEDTRKLFLASNSE